MKWDRTENCECVYSAIVGKVLSCGVSRRSSKVFGWIGLGHESISENQTEAHTRDGPRVNPVCELENRFYLWNVPHEARHLRVGSNVH